MGHPLPLLWGVKVLKAPLRKELPSPGLHLSPLFPVVVSSATRRKEDRVSPREKDTQAEGGREEGAQLP